MTLPVNARLLVSELRQTLSTIETQIDQLKKDAEDRVYFGPGILDWHMLRDQNGSYLATPLILAKANCLSAIANLQAADIAAARRK